MASRITKRTLALMVLMTALLSIGGSAALSSTVLAQKGPVGRAGKTGQTGVMFDSAGYVVGPPNANGVAICSDNPNRLKQIRGCSRLKYLP